ncbi:complex I 51 kDa subunit family protein [Hippea alviniae]|uniref:complex I 51 kDa subunit family protein n=1 Tax=Hippea alviniae TaxID=1279027 RepID=UPI0004070481|nr:NADH-ubiquinone oxidoreductase-F iron-sulfur binding region domain-containing protein [Hippea alviniae]
MRAIVSKSVKKPIIITKEEISIEQYVKNGGYKALEKALTKSSKEIVEEIKKSGLKGRGGAAFPTGIKWEVVANSISKTKFVVCNADEGEPGTFKDRWIMENRPHLIIEAMAICGYATGSSKGYIYIRGEYENSIETMKRAVHEAYNNGFLGNRILNSNFSFDIEIRKGAGSYVCGEETALLESIEGKRAHPRFKPPFPGVKGLFSYPTVVNNVETFANVPFIIANGHKAFTTYGTKNSFGTKLFSVSGSVKNPSLIEANLGITLNELFKEIGGVDGEFQAALVGGAAGSFVFSDELNLPLSYETLKEKGKTLGSGSILVLNRDDNIKLLVRNVLEFFRHESCGKCIPCRNGYPKILSLFDSYIEGDTNSKIELLNLANLMFKTSLCALGQSAKGVLDSYFSRY